MYAHGRSIFKGWRFHERDWNLSELSFSAPLKSLSVVLYAKQVLSVFAFSLVTFIASINHSVSGILTKLKLLVTSKASVSEMWWFHGVVTYDGYNNGFRS